MSTILRLNCNVGLGDTVLVSKVDPKSNIVDAKQIELYPLSSSDNTQAKSASSSEDTKVLFIQQQLVGQYVMEGHNVAISFQGKIHKFVIHSISSSSIRSLQTPTSTGHVNSLTGSPKPKDTTSLTSSSSSITAVSSDSSSIGTSADQTPIVRVTLGTKLRIIPKPEEKDENSSAKLSAPVLDFNLVGGLRTQIEELKELVELPLKKPEVFWKYGIKPPRGVLLFGPPGTGKTLLAKVLAQVTGASCYTLSAPEIMSKYYGESEARLRELFLTAEANSPSIIFIDEIDAIAPKRDSSDSEVSKRIVATLLTLMDGMESNNGKNEASNFPPRVVVLAATNRPNALDPALRRPGRFDREIEIPIPNEAGRAEILNVYFSKMQHSLSKQDLARVAGATHGYVGADLSNLCKEAALCTFKRAMQAMRVGELSQASSSSSSSSDAPNSSIFASKSPSLELNHDQLMVNLEDVMHAMSEIRPSAMREIMVDIPKVKWDDIGGYDEVKEKLKQAVEWPLLHPQAFKRLNIQPTRGVLLYGPPGCSKTLLAKAVATQAGLNFIPIKGPELFSKYVGESERAVREVFRKARAASPSIVFFDEIDAIGGERGQGADSTSVHDRVLAQMLNELDGIEPLKSVLFLAATNRPDIIDKALMRPGRIDQAIYISPPDPSARRKIFEINLKKIPHNSDLDINQLVTLTSGFSGAEVTSACREAALAALQEDINSELVQARHFISAISSIVPTITDTMIEFYQNFANSKRS
jgi:AAA family ATPase